MVRHKNSLTAKTLNDGIAEGNRDADTNSLANCSAEKDRNLSLPLLHHRAFQTLP